MGITSHQMEGAARHMELPSTIPILTELGHIYEYVFVCQVHSHPRQRDCSLVTTALAVKPPPTFFELRGSTAVSANASLKLFDRFCLYLSSIMPICAHTPRNQTPKRALNSPERRLLPPSELQQTAQLDFCWWRLSKPAQTAKAGISHVTKGLSFCHIYSITVREFCLCMVASICLGTAWVAQLPMVALAAALAASLAFLVA